MALDAAFGQLLREQSAYFDQLYDAQVEFEALIVEHQAALDRTAKEKAKLDEVDDR